MTFSSVEELAAEINRRCSVAVKNVADKMEEKLREYVTDDFYNMYAPKKYDRKFKFQNSPNSEMLSENLAKIFIDTSNMSYQYASGSQVAMLASGGFHGNTGIFRPGFFWQDFVAWADANVPQMLREELESQGLSVK